MPSFWAAAIAMFTSELLRQYINEAAFSKTSLSRRLSIAALLMYIPGLDTLVITGERRAELPSAAAAPRIRDD